MCCLVRINGETLMPVHKTVLKRQRQNLRRRMINKRNRTKLRNQIKKLRALIARGAEEEARQALPATIVIIDKSVANGILHKNAAARLKSKLTLQVNSLGAKAPTSDDSS